VYGRAQFDRHAVPTPRPCETQPAGLRRFQKGTADGMGILWTVIIVLIVLAVVFFFMRGRR
jgi:hypothetical protein